MIRSLNCQNPHDEATLLPSLLHSGTCLGPSGRCRALPAPPPAGAPWIGSGRGAPSSSTCTSPPTAAQAGKEARLPRNVHAGGLVVVFFFVVVVV